jgi:hypothetical protein
MQRWRPAGCSGRRCARSCSAGPACSFGWCSTEGGYSFAFLTGHIDDHDRGDRLENTLREVLGLPAL